MPSSTGGPLIVWNMGQKKFQNHTMQITIITYSKHDLHSLVPFRTMQIRTIRGPLYYLYFINVSHKQDVLLTLNGCGTFTYTTTYKAIHPPPTLSLPSSTYQFVKICLALAMVA